MVTSETSYLTDKVQRYQKVSGSFNLVVKTIKSQVLRVISCLDLNGTVTSLPGTMSATS